MKKIIVTTVLAVILSLGLMAHPPKKVEASFNNETGKLKITATHPVADITTHYIITVTVTVDGNLVKTLKYTQQTNKEKLVDEIAIPEIKKGSKVVVNATCNKFGSKSATITL